MTVKLNIKQKLERLRTAIRKECISYGEILELQSLKEHIEDGDVELLQWAENQSEESDNKVEEMKKDVQKEILAILDEKIDNEINAMESFYTVAEIAKEVLLQVGKK